MPRGRRNQVRRAHEVPLVELPGDEHEVESIVGHEGRGRNTTYLVKWKNYNGSPWRMSIDKLDKCEDALKEYRLKKERDRKLKKKLGLARVQARDEGKDEGIPLERAKIEVSACMVCMQNVAEFSCIPCGHLCFCPACSDYYHYQSGCKNCPYCRCRYSSITKQFMNLSVKDD